MDIFTVQRYHKMTLKGGTTSVIYDPESGEGKDVAGFSPKGIIHWVDANADT